MCGLAAVFGGDAEAAVATMLPRLAHRGPDGEGSLALGGPHPGTLGHRRLAIIDPEGGAQPLVDPADPGRALVANGMIYNDLALRRALGRGRFATDTDSESILQACAADGPEGVRRLDGMFAFVYRDDAQIVAARDRLGIKPLYVCRAPGRVAFASEAKALLGVADDMEMLPPGHLLRIGADGRASKPRRYYTLPRAGGRLRRPDEAAAALRAEVEAAVIKRLRSDVPLGCFLSGGLDSSIVAALAVRHRDPAAGRLKTFAVGLEGADDLAAARRVAEHLGTEHHEHRIAPAEVRAALPKILYHLESYDRDLVRSAVPTWFVARLAARHVKVVLTGEGADELFAGYAYHKAYGPTPALQRELRRSLGTMHNLNLQRVDRMAMAHGLEARVPYLDPQVIACAMAVHPALKLYPTGPVVSLDAVMEKWILRHAFAELLPEGIAWRRKAQFDEGSGLAGLLQDMVPDLARDAAPLPPGPKAPPRDREEAVYARLLADGFDDPAPILAQVARWASDRVAA